MLLAIEITVAVIAFVVYVVSVHNIAMGRAK